jgi:hypothetical protein
LTSAAIISLGFRKSERQWPRKATAKGGRCKVVRRTHPHGNYAAVVPDVFDPQEIVRLLEQFLLALRYLGSTTACANLAFAFPFIRGKPGLVRIIPQKRRDFPAPFSLGDMNMGAILIELVPPAVLTAVLLFVRRRCRFRMYVAAALALVTIALDLWRRFPDSLVIIAGR